MGAFLPLKGDQFSCQVRFALLAFNFSALVLHFCRVDECLDCVKNVYGSFMMCTNAHVKTQTWPNLLWMPCNTTVSLDVITGHLQV